MSIVHTINTRRAASVTCLSFLLIIIASFRGEAQTGSLFIANHYPSDQSLDNYNYDILETQQGLIQIANRHGLISFDGASWEITPTPYAIFFLEESKDGTIYAGGRLGFGKFVTGDDLELEFVAIDSTFRDLFHSFLKDDLLYMINEDNLIIHNTLSNETTVIQSGESGDFEEVNGNSTNVWVSTSDEGILQIENLELTEPELQPNTKSEVKRTNQAGVSAHFTFTGEVFLETEFGFEKVNIQDEGYLDEHTVTQIEWIDNRILAIGTLSGGILFTDAENGKILGISNFESGLPDEEIYSMAVDRNGGLWLAHARGISIISPLIPVENFSTFQGLSGDLLQVAHFENSIYVATSTGVYKLISKPTYVEEVVNVQSTASADDESLTKAPKKRKGLFGRRKRKQQAPETEVPRQKTITRLVSTQYIFQHVEGLSSKTTQLLVFKDQLFAGTQGGAFKIENQTATKILDLPVEHLFGDHSSGILFVSTSEETTEVLQEQNGQWMADNLLDGLNDLVGQIIADDEDYLWLCGADSVYRISLDENNLKDIDVYKIYNPHFENLHATRIHGQLVFTNSAGYYLFDGDTIIQTEEIAEEKGLPTNFLLSPTGELWIRTRTGWIGQSNTQNKALRFLSLVPDPRALEIQNDSIFWVITARNELFKVNGQRFAAFKTGQRLLLKQARTSRRKLNVDDISITQDEGAISFEFISPDYMKIYGTVYQYRLNGLSSDWSQWSGTNNMITYPFLPPNTYTLELRTRDALGNIETASPITFDVEAPYWRRPWFYALELCFFGGLLFFSFRLNQENARYTVLSRLLSFMTLILIVEFFQTIAESSLETDESPVIDFFIQAFIALLILPVEGLIRKFITGNSKKDMPLDMLQGTDTSKKEND